MYRSKAADKGWGKYMAEFKIILIANQLDILTKILRH